jgi:double zinc ribbon protein
MADQGIGASRRKDGPEEPTCPCYPDRAPSREGPGMQCPRCHAENRDGLRFSEDCGSRLTLTCAQCGGELAPGKRFCGSCGAPAVGESTAHTPTPESYTPKHLAEKILTSKAALEGERKQVTVLFADLKGSMELLADRDPEEARKLLDPVRTRLAPSPSPRCRKTGGPTRRPSPPRVGLLPSQSLHGDGRDAGGDHLECPAGPGHRRGGRRPGTSHRRHLPDRLRSPRGGGLSTGGPHVPEGGRGTRRQRPAAGSLRPRRLPGDLRPQLPRVGARRVRRRPGARPRGAAAR